MLLVLAIDSWKCYKACGLLSGNDRVQKESYSVREFVDIMPMKPRDKGLLHSYLNSIGAAVKTHIAIYLMEKGSYQVIE